MGVALDSDQAVKFGRDIMVGSPVRLMVTSVCRPGARWFCGPPERAKRVWDRPRRLHRVLWIPERALLGQGDERLRQCSKQEARPSINRTS